MHPGIIFEKLDALNLQKLWRRFGFSRSLALFGRILFLESVSFGIAHFFIFLLIRGFFGKMNLGFVIFSYRLIFYQFL